MAVELLEALAAERLKRQREATEVLTRQEVAKVVLGALAERLNDSPPPRWTFLLEGDHIKIIYGSPGSQSVVGAWKLDDQMRLTMRDTTTEWITSESFARVIDEAVRATAKLIVDREVAEEREGAEIVELPPRF